jgi:putative tryptophan/tyrosine transport system substrate-binding protein
MRRREFIFFLSSVTALPLAAGAQQHEQMRRVAMLLGGLECGDASGQIAAFEEGLKELGTRGQDIDLNDHWPGPQTARVRAVADGNLVVSRSTPATVALMHESLPIVFVLVVDPIGSGFVQNLGHPGFNVTGFSTFEFSAGGKWLALLQEAAPKVSRIALLFNPDTARAIGPQLAADSRRARRTTLF